MSTPAEPAFSALPAEIKALVTSCAAGDRRAASRLISQLESPDPREARVATRAVSALPWPKHTIGLTGPPGAGKSTLLDYLVGLTRKRGGKVGVIAIDPSSPFTGGALLGDRIRMSSHRSDTGVFIRSMGSRGASGGIAAAASDALRVLGGAGYETVFLETVGAGQAETEVIRLADSVCVVQVPGLGDDIQLMKMGMLEIADLFIVNKADRPGAKELKEQIEQALGEAPGEVCRSLRQVAAELPKPYTGPSWFPAVLLVSGLDQTGGAEVLEALDRHRNFLAAPELTRLLQRNRATRELLSRASRRFGEELAARLAVGGRLAALADACAERRMDLESAMEEIFREQP